MCWNAVYALLILFSTASTYWCAAFIQGAKRSWGRKTALAVNIAVNIGILFVFKYYNMFASLIGSIFSLLGISLQPVSLSLLLPVGISFYTFQALGYSIDVYRGTIQHRKDFLTYALFVSFFPQLVAGPIERSGNLLGQFYEEHPFDYENVAAGLRMMLLGFFKKVVIADNIAIAVDRMYTFMDQFPGPVLLYGAILFTIQLYCDFSGYSDIAIGAARVMGFRLMKNFDHPFFARSIPDYWRRWHISLSTWLRDYIYIPLGGSRVPLARHCFNLFITFLISGLWHGASWTFVAWGVLHGLYQIGSLLLRNYQKKHGISPVPGSHPLRTLLCCCMTFLLVSITYVFFRSSTFSQAIYFFGHFWRDWSLFGDPHAALSAFISLADSIRLTLIIFFSVLALFLLELYEIRSKKSYGALLARLRLRTQWCIYYVMLFAIALFGSFGQSSFIYFQF